jgi:gonadotropin-releasing hormone receptor
MICWLSSFIVALPQLFIFEQSLKPSSLTKYRCASTGYTAEWQRRVYFTIFASYVLVIPVLCMSVWYIRIISIVSTSKKNWTQNFNDQTATSPTNVRTVKLALTIIIVFVVCWTPYMVITLIEIYSNGRFHTPPWLDGVLQTICLMQSGLNPFIYKAFNQRRKYSPTLILVAASTYSQKPDRRKLRERTGGSISLCSIPETASRRHVLYSEKENLFRKKC